MKNINNILIIGITGNGKSALASLLADNDEFKVGHFGTGKTKRFQVSNEPFEWRGKKYRIIDNIGFGDASGISEEEIFLEVGEGIHSAKEGINQILFVFKGKFFHEHIEVFNRFKKFISESGITKYTTLIRTNFPKFEDGSECEKDKRLLLAENEEISEIINSCDGGIIYIDNPPIPKIDEDETDSDDEEERKIIQEKKKASRKKVLNHLSKNCNETYKIGRWNNICQIIGDYIKRRDEIELKQDGSSTKESELSRLKNEVIKSIKAHLEEGLTTSAIVST